MSTSAKVFCLFCMVALFPIWSQAQSTTQVPAKQKARESDGRPKKQQATVIPTFSPTFWLGSDASKEKYLANNPKSVFKWLELKLIEQDLFLPRKPDSFSTSEDRDEYAKAIKTTAPPLPPLPIPIKCEKNYNVDRQFFRIEVVADLRIAGSDNIELQRFEMDLEPLKVRSISTITTDLSSTGSYTAQNAFGATIEVRKTSTQKFVLVIPFGTEVDPITSFISKYPGHKNLAQFGSYVIEVPMPPARAREISDEIQCLGVISLFWPALTYREATILPHRWNGFTRQSEFEYGMLGKLDGVIVFNKSTGEVYREVLRAGSPL